MISITPRSSHSPRPTLKLIAAGNAGINVMDRISVSLGGGLETAALNTDSQSLNACVACARILLGPKTTRGLGAGGDPELGRTAIEETASELNSLLEDAGVFLLCAGLGGGTGGPVIAHLARRIRDAGKHCAAILTLPFRFEGRRRAAQADADLAAIQAAAGVVAIFPNDGMVEVPESSGGVADAFAACDNLLAGAAISLLDIFRSSGPLQLSAGDLFGTLRSGNARSLFTHAAASGPNRANEVMTRALKSPLARAGIPLEQAGALIAHVAAGPDLKLVEVQAVLDQLGRHLEDSTSLRLGISATGAGGQDLRLTLFGSAAPAASEIAPAATAACEPEGRIEPVAPDPEEPAANSENSAPEPDLQPEIPQSATAEPDVPIPDLPANFGEPAAGDLFPEAIAPPPAPTVKPAKKPVKARQEILPLEVAARGRFEKSEPTIVEGEDLDVPTFLRQKIKLK